MEDDLIHQMHHFLIKKLPMKRNVLLHDTSYSTDCQLMPSAKPSSFLLATNLQPLCLSVLFWHFLQILTRLNLYSLRKLLSTLSFSIQWKGFPTGGSYKEG